MNPAGRDCQAGGGGLTECVTGGAKGLLAAIVAFGIWGVLPVYWKQLEFMGATSLVAQRTCWTLLALWPLLVATEFGLGKCTSLDDYRIQKRGGKGIFTLKRTDRTGNVVALMEVSSDEEIMLITRGGVAIR